MNAHSGSSNLPRGVAALRDPTLNKGTAFTEAERDVLGEVNTEVGQIIVAEVDQKRVGELLAPDREALWSLIRKEG
ncbi:MAG TPA: hypothetical protein VGQ24_03580 [Gemmatimonadales bacterium]|jgi:hypothetical protein|nr:hypothetical protein [Gemmatimonadales bacterium]